MNTQLQTRFQGRSSQSEFEGGELRVGRGVSRLRLGLTLDEVRHILGNPAEEVSKYRGHFYVIFKNAGIDVEFRSRSGKAEKLFFFARGVEGHSNQPRVWIEDISFRADADAVRRAFGTPDEEGSDWYLFNSGIQFNFDVHKQVKTIAIFPAGVIDRS